ncbi:hypothetical protein [Nocardia heshunensis]
MDTTALSNYIELIHDKEKDLYGLVSNAEKDFDSLQKSIAYTSMASIAGAPAGLAAVLLLESKKGDVIDAIDKCVNGNQENGNPGILQFVDGMYLPLTLIKVADEWRNVKGNVTNAEDAVNAAAAKHWRGYGATNYETMRYKEQMPAFKAMVAFCEKCASELEDTAKSVVGFYGDLQDNINKLVDTVKNFVHDFSSAKLVWSFINLVTDVCSTITTLIMKIVKVLTDAQISSNRLKQETTSQEGFTWSNTWPNPDTNSFSDFSPTDGDNVYNHWSIIK